MHLVNTVNPTNEGAGMSIMQNFNTPPSCADIRGMFNLGTYPFGNSLTGIDGAKVFIIDSDGEPWGSDFGNGNQTGSNFEIIAITPSGDTLSEYYVEATFNCKLYHPNGTSKQLSNGYMNSRAGQCN